MALKKRKTTPKPTPSIPLPQNSKKFITKVMEDDYQFLSHTPFVFERGFLTMAINFGNLLHGRRSWSKMCEHPPLGVAPFVREFRTNLRDKFRSIVFVRGKWVSFDASTINRAFG